MIRYRVQEIEEGEKPTSFYIQKEMKRNSKKKISYLEINGQYIKQKSEIFQTVFEFYHDLYGFSETDNKTSNIFLETVDKISCGDRFICEGLLTYAECLEALKLMAKYKSPGLDGLPVKFYKKFLYLFGPKLVDYYNYAFDWGRLTLSQRQALIMLLCKNFDLHMLLTRWRPVSLLTIDYKIISKVMSLRLKKFFPTSFIQIRNVRWREDPFMKAVIWLGISLIMWMIDPIWGWLYWIST